MFLGFSEELVGYDIENLWVYGIYPTAYNITSVVGPDIDMDFTVYFSVYSRYYDSRGVFVNQFHYNDWRLSHAYTKEAAIQEVALELGKDRITSSKPKAPS